jgi:hypothetical protein
MSIRSGGCVFKPATIRFAATLVVVIGAVMLSAAVAVVALTRAPGSAGLGPLVWLLPLATLAVVSGIALLLPGEDSRPEAESDAEPSLEDCPACGREVSGEWRLCPWCGDRIGARGRDRAA